MWFVRQVIGNSRSLFHLIYVFSLIERFIAVQINQKQILIVNKEKIYNI